MGTGEVFGFIAQEVLQQLPEAVQIITNFIPDIYQTYNYTRIDDYNIILEVSLIIETGAKLSLVKDNKTYISTVTKNEPNSITVTLDTFLKESVNNTILIYGTQVNDFCTLRKDYLFTINFAATQELDRIINWHTKEQDPNNTAQVIYGDSLSKRIKTLEDDNALLKTENTSLKTQLSAMQNQINDILARLS
jgi:hypothetical protein